MGVTPPDHHRDIEAVADGPGGGDRAARRSARCRPLRCRSIRGRRDGSAHPAAGAPCGHVERLQRQDFGPQRRGDVPADYASRIDVGTSDEREAGPGGDVDIPAPLIVVQDRFVVLQVEVGVELAGALPELGAESVGRVEDGPVDAGELRARRVPAARDGEPSEAAQPASASAGARPRRVAAPSRAHRAPRRVKRYGHLRECGANISLLRVGWRCVLLLEAVECGVQSACHGVVTGAGVGGLVGPEEAGGSTAPIAAPTIGAMAVRGASVA